MAIPHPPLPNDLVTFNVRGCIFQTTLTTLRQFPESIPYKIVQDELEGNRAPSIKSEVQVLQAFFIDRDPDLFAAILQFYDTKMYANLPSNITPQSLHREAEYYGLQSLVEQIASKTRMRDKYEFCCVSSQGNVVLSLCNEAIVYGNSYSGFEKLNLDLPVAIALMSVISDELNKRNARSDGFSWTFVLSEERITKEALTVIKIFMSVSFSKERQCWGTPCKVIITQ